MATYGFKQAPKGLKPVTRQGSAKISFSTQKSYIAVNTPRSIGNNEVVQLGAGFIVSPAANTPNNPAVADELNAFGIFSGVYYKITQFPGEIRGLYFASGTLITPGTQIVAQVLHDSNMEYEIQVNSATGLTQAQVGGYANLGNINFIDGSANGTGGITQGQSTASLDLTTWNADSRAAAGGLFDVEIVGLSERVGNYFATNAQPQPYNFAIVKFNSFRQ